MHYTSGTTGKPKGVTTGLWDERTARAVFDDEAAVWHFDADDLHLVCSPMYHTVSVRFCAGTLLSGGSLAILSRFDASTALDAVRRLRPTTAFLVPTHLQRILQAPELGPRRELRFAPPLGPCRGPVPTLGEAGDHGAGPPGRRVGVLRVDRGPVHGLRPRRMAGAPRDGGPGPAGASPVHRVLPTGARRGRRATSRATTARAPSGATCPTSPVSAIGGTRKPPRRPGGARPAPWAIWAGWMPRAISTSRGAGTTSSSAEGSTSTRPRWKRCSPPCRGSSSWRSSECPTRSGDKRCAWPMSPTGAGSRTPCGRRRRSSWRRTSGPRTTSPRGSCRTRPPGS